MRGYFEIGVYCPKREVNIGTLFRSAYQLGANSIFIIGKRFKFQSSDTCNTHKHIPLREYEDFNSFINNRPHDSLLIAVESPEYQGRYLKNYTHPERACYLLGSEDNGLPLDIVKKCNQVISIESARTPSFNVSIAGSIVMYDRYIKQLSKNFSI